MKKFTLAASAFLLFFLSDAAFGCCVDLPDQTPESIRIERQSAFDEATAVFTGEVIKLDDFKAEFRIDKIWKGDFARHIIMLTGTKHNGDGTRTSSSCDYSYESGKKYLIFAYGKSDELQTGCCSRSRTMANAAEEIKGLEEITPHKDMNESPSEQPNL